MAAIRVAGLVFALGAVTSLASPGSAAASPKNVVVVMTDDMTASQLSVMKQTRDRLGDDGVSFSRSFATQPLCCPSRCHI